MRILSPCLCSDDEGDEESVFWTPMRWKRAHLVLFSYVFMISLLALWEFSYSRLFGDYVWYFIIGFKVVQVFIDIGTARLMRESLLISPLMVTLEITEVVPHQPLPQPPPQMPLSPALPLPPPQRMAVAGCGLVDL